MSPMPEEENAPGTLLGERSQASKTQRRCLSLSDDVLSQVCSNGRRALNSATWKQPK